MKKRLFAVLLVSAMILTMLAACSSSNPEADQSTSGTASSGSENESGNAKEPVNVILNEVAHSIFYAPMYVAIEEGYFEEEGIDLELVTGFGADKTMTAVLSGSADIGFMGSEATIYTYNEGAKDYVVNFAQLTQRAGNFLVAREEMPDFTWDDLKGKKVLGGRKGGMPEMVFEYILKQNGIDPAKDLEIDQSIDFGSTAAAFSEGQADFTVEFEYFLHQQNKLRSITPRSISLLNRNLDCLDTNRQSLRSDRLSIRFPFRPAQLVHMDSVLDMFGKSFQDLDCNCFNPSRLSYCTDDRIMRVFINHVSPITNSLDMCGHFQFCTSVSDLPDVNLQGFHPFAFSGSAGCLAITHRIQPTVRLAVRAVPELIIVYGGSWYLWTCCFRSRCDL